MAYQNLSYEFNNFVPSIGLRSKVRLLAERISFESPSDATVKIIYNKNDSNYEAICQVSSVAGYFSANVESTNLDSLAQLLEKRMNEQLMEWKTQRWASHSLETISKMA